MAIVLLTITWNERRQSRDLKALAPYVLPAAEQKSRIAVVYFPRSGNTALAGAAPANPNELPSAVMGKASEALVTLAITGNPNPLQAELGGTVMASEDLQRKVGNLLNLEKQEHLAFQGPRHPDRRNLCECSTGMGLEIILSLSRQGFQDVQKGRSSKAAGPLAGGAYEGVREHGKGARTPLANFFNILLRTISSWSITRARPDGWTSATRKDITCHLWSRPSWKTAAPPGTSNSGIGLPGN